MLLLGKDRAGGAFSDSRRDLRTPSVRKRCPPRQTTTPPREKPCEPASAQTVPMRSPKPPLREFRNDSSHSAFWVAACSWFSARSRRESISWLFVCHPSQREWMTVLASAHRPSSFNNHA